MNRRDVIAAGLSGLMWAPSWAATRSMSPRLNKRRLRRVRTLLEKNVEAGIIAGGVAMLLSRGETVLLEAVGYRDLTTREPMREDTIFQIMSMSKPFIAASVMVLVEASKLSLSDSIERHLPEFGDPWLIAHRSEDRLELKRPVRTPTIFELLTHSAGIIDMPAVIGRGRFLFKLTLSLAEIAGMVSQSPLDYEPGTQSVYSNAGIAMAARIVEKVAGVSYDAFVHEHFFKPLGMRDSFFFPQPVHWPRIPACYQRVDDRLVEMGDGTPGGRNTRLRVGARCPVPEAGIYATASDIAKFYQLMLQGGRWQGAQVLSAQSVGDMIKSHIRTSAEPGSDRYGTDQGLAWRVATSPVGSHREPVTAAASFSHAGALGTYGWADPQHDLVGILQIQQPDALDLRRDFVAIVREALN